MARCQLFPLAVFAALAVGACGGDGPSGPTTGTLAITATGIPSGVSLDVTVTGPGGLREEIAAPATLDNLRPGDYQVDAATVQAGASWYAPDPPTRTVSVTAGATATAAIAFDNVATEAVNFTVEAAYLTQSIQTTAGTVSLVRGRDALLRVFVRADRAGAAAPPVRVRLFAGGTLRQTLLLAPPAIAPKSIEEAELSRSWNVIVPGSSLEPGFALLADVDPDNQIAEGFETDNVFPATGQPQPVSVRVSPPLRIRFIPIQSGSA